MLRPPSQVILPLAATVAFIFSLAAQDCVAQPMHAREITIQDLASLRDMHRLSISPDQTSIAFAIFQGDVRRNAYASGWYVFDLASGNTRHLADAGELMPATFQGEIGEYQPPPAPKWSTDGDWITFLRRENGSTQAWRAHRAGHSVEQLTHNAGDVRAAVFSTDGRTLLFETEPSRAQLDALLHAEGLHGFLYDRRFHPMYDVRPAMPRDVDLNVRQHTNSEIASRRVWAYDFQARREHEANADQRAEFITLTSKAQPSSGQPHLGQTASSPEGALAWAEARDPNRQGMLPPLTIVAQVNANGSPISCDAVACTADRLAGLWWRDNDEVLFIRREGLRLQDRALYAWRPRSGEPPRLIFRTAARFGDDTGCAPARDLLICLYEEPDYPRRLVGIDLTSGELTPLHDPNPGFAQFALGARPQRISIHAASGAETFGYLVLPPRAQSGRRLPLVIVTYRCGGFLRGGVGDEYPIFPFAAQGFAVLCFELPDDFERMAQLDPVSYSNWMRGPEAPVRRRIEQTLAAAVEQLDRRGIIDPDRVGVTGLSYGAETVGFALQSMPRLAAAISSGNPGPGPGQYVLLGPTVRETFRSWGIRSPEETPDRWREIGFSPNVHRVRAPLLINVADHEMLSALDAVVALEDANRAVEMHVFPNEYHVKWQPAHRAAIYERNIDWMNFWLRNTIDLAPSKIAQYARWNELRRRTIALSRTPASATAQSEVSGN